MQYDNFLSGEHLQALLEMCPPPDLRRLVFTQNSGTASGVFTTPFELPVGRGMYYGVEVICEGLNLLELQDISVQFAINGRTILENDAASYYSTFFQNKKTFIDILGWGGSTFVPIVTVESAGAIVAVPFKFQFHWTQNNGLSPNTANSLA